VNLQAHFIVRVQRAVDPVEHASATVFGFGALLQQAEDLRSDAIRSSAHTDVAAAIEGILGELAKPSPSAQALQAGALELQQRINAVSPPDASFLRSSAGLDTC